MDLRNLTKEQFLELAQEEGKASINIGLRPHPSAFPREPLIVDETSETSADTLSALAQSVRRSATGVERKAS